jgi:predicted amidophosphoribosyltransferase
VVLDLLLPRRCVACGDAGALLCDACRLALPRLRPPLCALCGAPVAWPVERCRECAGRRLAFASARAAVPYDDDVRRFVRRWKEGGLRSLAAEAAQVVVDRVPRPEADLVTFVPPDVWRARRRGHHPAEQLARALAERWQLPCAALLRATAVQRQRDLSRAERQRNPAFRAVATVPSAVLVDDVYTTGATVSAAAHALGGAVHVVTFARTTRTSS